MSSAAPAGLSVQCGTQTHIKSMNTVFTLEYTQIICPSQNSNSFFLFLKHKQSFSKPKEVKDGLERKSGSEYEIYRME